MDVFVAYSNRDEQRVRAIVDWLRSKGLAVWVAYELPAGLDWDAEIDRVLAKIPCVLTVWSPDAAASAEVKGEARAAMARHALVTVSLDGALPPRSFTHLHAVDLTGLTADEQSPRTEQVLRGIRSKLVPPDVVGEAAPAQHSDRVAMPTPARASGRFARMSTWATLAGVLLGGALLLAIYGGDATAEQSCDDEGVFRLTGQTFSKDTTIDEAVVCVADNAHIRVKNGASLTVDADTLILQGTARFDGRGSDGAAGQAGSDGPQHTHVPPVVLGISICAGAPPRADYDGQPGRRGGNGSQGATIRIRYSDLQGDPAGLAHNVSGGRAGPGGRGGKGGRAVCKAGKSYDVNGRRGASGPSGSPGADGTFELAQRAG